MDAMKSFQDYIRRLNKEDRITIYSGSDNDGLCSSVITSVAIERLRGRPVDLHLYSESQVPEISESHFKLIDANKTNKMIILDLSIDNSNRRTLEQLSNYSTLVIDHHKVTGKLPSQRLNFVKPYLFSDIPDVYYPTSKLTYDLFSELVEISDLDWISSVGIISDSAYPAWEQFVGNVFKKYGLRKGEDIWKSDLGVIASYIGSATIYDPSLLDECFEVLSKAKSPKEVLGSSLKRYKQIIDNEIQRLIKDFSENAETHQDIVFYDMESKFDLCSTLSTIVSHTYMPNKTLFIFQKKNGNVVVNARRQDNKVNLVDLIRESLKELEGASGGGHIPAAGANIQRKDLNKFKKNLLENLEK